MELAESCSQQPDKYLVVTQLDYIVLSCDLYVTHFASALIQAAVTFPVASEMSVSLFFGSEDGHVMCRWDVTSAWC